MFATGFSLTLARVQGGYPQVTTNHKITMSLFKITLFGFTVFSIVRQSQPRDSRGRFVSANARVRKQSIVDAIPVPPVGAVFRPLTQDYINKLDAAR